MDRLIESFEKYYRYIAEQKHKWDYQNALDTALRKGIVEVAINLKNMNLSLEDIIKATGLTQEEIERL